MDESTSAITELSPLGGYLSQIPGAGSRRFALNRSTGEVYAVAGENGPNAIGVYASNGALLRTIPFGYSGCGEIAIAVDNSGGAGGPGEGEQGRLYLTYNCSVRGVQALSPNGSPVDFSASAGYIFGNEITGTPAGEFESPGRVVATDAHGDIYIFGRVTGEENGDVYEFAPSGSFVRSFTGAEVPGGLPEEIEAIAVDPTNGNLLFAGYNGESPIFEFSETGKFLQKFSGISESSRFQYVTGLAVSSSGYLYAADSYGGVVDVFLPLGFGPLPEATTEAATEIERNSANLHAKAGLGGGSDITGCRFEYTIAAEYKPWAEPEPYTATAPCLNSAGETVGTSGNPIAATTALHASAAGLHAGDTFHFRIALTNGDEVPRYGSDQAFETPPAVTGVKTLPATEVTNKSARLHGSFTGEDIPTTYRFEYTTEADFEDHGYGTAAKLPVPDGGAPEGTGEVLVSPLEATELAPNTAYVYRLVATNKFGTTLGENQPFSTFQPPTIEGFFTSHVTATSADLEAKINPQGFATECHFEYGATTSLGTSVPCPESLVGHEGITVVIPIAGLQSGTTYFRVIAESKWGVVSSEEQTFEFFPPPCPNAAIRNQTGTAYLPDCRAYELVSPPNADGTLLYAGGPNTGQATNPPRFSFTGLFGSIPGAETVNSVGDLYVATRTDTGWNSHYVGLPGSQAGCVGGPPNYPLSHIVYPNPPYITNSVPADPSMEKFLVWNDGTPIACFDGTSPYSDTNWEKDSPSNAPYMYNAEGAELQRVPTDFPGESNDVETALKCPYTNPDTVTPACTSEVDVSEDLSHFVFSSNTTSFASGGLTKVPGSAYDDELATGKLALISLTANGQNIPQDPVFAKTPPQTYSGNIEVAGGEEEYLRFPAVSADGSHILISTATAGTTVCRNGGEIRFGLCPRFTATPVHLYMRVEDMVTHEIAAGKPVTFVGMTPDGSKVFFTSEEHLTPEDPEHVGASLYMWSEKGEKEGHPLTLISKAQEESQPGGSGNTGDCHPALRNGVPWTTSCSAVPISTYLYSFLTGGAGGNGFSDSAISANGDIYFYSPEQLDHTKGIPGLENVYDYRNGKAQYVTTLKPEEKCTQTAVLGNETVCTPEAVLRINVNLDDTHMAFVTGSRLSAYENAGHLEMYSYTPTSGTLVCDSCNPDGQPATADVHASQDGLFMSNDGRTFFSTNESLVPEDTNEGPDVYEFVDGRPQLITPGTGTASIGSAAYSFAAANELPGLVGVSANGTDVYFSTFDALVSGDRNGNFFRFYDARTNGGFAQAPPSQPCAAAEECHGQGNEPPELPTQGTAARLAGGNLAPHHQARQHKRHKRKGRRHHRRAGHRGRKTTR